ncbi:hypothetical protein GCM10008018_15760 [Paenibacillus marchantiophytorum]|uniref:Uncharacterized protein n=1 Tax=Paenibacillus marchantiophytorum TaxID=1619310 RepID=A0ABQ2BU11_9BACL|nr:hypothetical protein GCM10008018_15760 [Paenibacillus marchantiophytorum]
MAVIEVSEHMLEFLGRCILHAYPSDFVGFRKASGLLTDKAVGSVIDEHE